VIKPFELSFPVEFAYYVVYPDSKTVMPKVGVFIRWLKEQADAASSPKLVNLAAVKNDQADAGARQRKRISAPRASVGRARRSLTAL
jgi:hypothetical protein